MVLPTSDVNITTLFERDRTPVVILNVEVNLSIVHTLKLLLQ